MNEMMERVTKALELVMIERANKFGMARDASTALARAAIEAMRELPEEPGPRYTAGEYSRKTQEAMVDDALGK